MTIFYFTATGNNLYIAKRIGGTLISIPQIMKTGGSTYRDDVIGVICPCYAGGVPRIVQRFLATYKLEAEYTFAIMTYGNEHTSALDEMDKYASAHGIQFDYMNYILMVNNYLPMFKVEEQMEQSVHKKIELSILTIIKDIQRKKQSKPDSKFKDKFWGAIFRSGAKKMIGNDADTRFTIDQTCTQCGTCSKVCPVDNIAIADAVTFKHQCEGCLACIHHCPSAAIHITGEKSKERFCNEHITRSEIIAANE